MASPSKDIRMEKFRIEVGPETLERSSMGTVGGEITVQVGAISFPDDAWRDCPVTILCWWSEAIVRLGSRVTKNAVCRFMDGPLWIEFRELGRASWNVRLIDDRHQMRCVLEAEVDPRQVLGELLHACEVIASRCRDNRWRSSDTARLDGFRDQLSLLSAGE